MIEVPYWSWIEIREEGEMLKTHRNSSVQIELIEILSSDMKSDIGRMFNLFEGRYEGKFPNRFVDQVPHALIEMNSSDYAG